MKKSTVKVKPKSAQKLKVAKSRGQLTSTTGKVEKGKGKGIENNKSILTSSTRVVNQPSLTNRHQEDDTNAMKCGEKSIISKLSTYDSGKKMPPDGQPAKAIDAKSGGPVLTSKVTDAKSGPTKLNDSLVSLAKKTRLKSRGVEKQISVSKTTESLKSNSQLQAIKSKETLPLLSGGTSQTGPGMVVPSSISADALGGFGLPSKLRNMGYQLGRPLGEGGFAKVFIATNERLFPGKPLACKIVKLREISVEWRRKHLDPEMTIMNELHHPNTMHAYFMAKSSSAAFIFMPLAEEGTIRVHIDMQRAPLLVDVARRWFRGLIDGLNYLHDKDIVHRDLKLENFFLRHRNQETIAVIGDFGFAVKQESKTVMATIFGSEIQCQTACGTADYVAPEVHCLAPNEKYLAKPVDIYAMGVSLFEMLNFWRPFFDLKRLEPYQMRDPTLVQRQKSMQFFWNPRGTSNEMAKKIIGRMLQPKPGDRPTARDVLGSPWSVATN